MITFSLFLFDSRVCLSPSLLGVSPATNPLAPSSARPPSAPSFPKREEEEEVVALSLSLSLSRKSSLSLSLRVSGPRELYFIPPSAVAPTTAQRFPLFFLPSLNYTHFCGRERAFPSSSSLRRCVCALVRLLMHALCLPLCLSVRRRLAFCRPAFKGRELQLNSAAADRTNYTGSSTC